MVIFFLENAYSIYKVRKPRTSKMGQVVRSKGIALPLCSKVSGFKTILEELVEASYVLGEEEAGGGTALPDQINMAVLLWYLVKSDASVRYCTV